ncbi:hypothetical protein AJ79_10348 [Helicocarpus griseus UAMH5409]|uniref:Uncharacterized protein n=1 Tax=Helicocarpus griseus UAMH5409 TaxID=1447875 RepID=A0A2B7WED2_9EURO|nr:hypothetical protein AJ79_10348 [Helicocarpus griseus UAMH5409]
MNRFPPATGLQLACSFCEDPEIESLRPRISYNSRTQILTARIKPTHILDSHQPWLDSEMLKMVTSGFLNDPERDHLNRLVGTTFQGFVAPYEASSKDPDACIIQDAQRLPTIVVETGWSESWPKLDDDKDLWLIGGAPIVQRVFLIRWSKLSGNRVKGEIHVYGRDGAGNPVLLQTELIFPVPSNGLKQAIPISRSQLFGPSVFTGRDPTDIFNLLVTSLRVKADPFIRIMGFVPA